MTMIHWNVFSTTFHNDHNDLCIIVITTFQCIVVLQSRWEGPKKNYGKNVAKSRGKALKKAWSNKIGWGEKKKKNNNNNGVSCNHKIGLPSIHHISIYWHILVCSMNIRAWTYFSVQCSVFSVQCSVFSRLRKSRVKTSETHY